MSRNLLMLNECNRIYSLDGFKYPEYWTDDERMNAFFSPFRSRNVNAENYEAKMTFWTNLIRDYCHYKGEGYFTKHELEIAFKRGQYIPTCLHTVLIEMQKRKIVCPRCQYEMNTKTDWLNWTINTFIKQPLSWTRSMFATMITLNKENEAIDMIEYVYINVMEEFCKRLYNKLQQPPFVGRLVNFNKLKDALAKFMHVTDRCLQVCLAKLHLDMKLGVHYQGESDARFIDFIKIPNNDDCTIIITEGDLVVYKLKSMQHDLMNQLKSIELEIEDNRRQILLHLEVDKRNLAKIYLRKKYLLKKNYDNHFSALYNVSAVLAAMDEAELTGTMLELYKDSSKALQDATNALNIQFDKSQKYISEIQDNIEQLKDIQDAVSINLNVNNSNDDEQLEMELDAIINTGKSKMNQQDCNVTKLLSVSSIVKLSNNMENLLIIKDSKADDSNSSYKKSTNYKQLQNRDTGLL